MYILRNIVIAKLFRMVRLAENTGFGFDKIDSNWKEYNGTEPEYSFEFDSTLVSLYTEVEEEQGKLKPDEGSGATPEEFQGKFGTIAEMLRRESQENLA